MGNMHKNLFIVSPNKLVLNFVFSYMKREKTIENVQLAFSVYLIRLTLSNELNQPVFSVEINNKINAISCMSEITIMYLYLRTLFPVFFSWII